MSEHPSLCVCAVCERQRIDVAMRLKREKRFEELMRQVHALRAARLSQDAARDASDWRNFFNFACRQSVRDHDKD